ncbi:MAG: hypothetical protein R3B97_02785 [Dehalococcoidia bacterium]
MNAVALQDEYEELIKRIAYLEDLLANPARSGPPYQGRCAEVRKQFG